MSALANRKQMTLFPVDAVDDVFGFIPDDMTCQCGHPLIATEDTMRVDSFACVTTAVRYECSNEDCEVQHDS